MTPTMRDLRIAAVWAASIVEQAAAFIREGRGCPSEEDYDRFCEEADEVARMAERAAARALGKKP